MGKDKSIPFNRQEGYRLEGAKLSGDKAMPDNNPYSMSRKGVVSGGQPARPEGYTFGPGGKYKC